MIRHRLAVVFAGLALGAVVAVAVAPGAGIAATASACSSAPIPFERIVEDAPRIFVVTVASRATIGGIPTDYTFVVREAIRGTVPDDVQLPTIVKVRAPVISACGDVLDARINQIVVLALDVPAFADAEPLAAAWHLRPDGTLVGGWDDGPETWVDLAAFRAAMAGDAFETPAPSDAAVVVAPPEEAPIASVGILVGILGGIAAGVVVVMLGRRAARPR